MSWYAKPSGGYTTEDTEAQANMFMIKDYLVSQGWSLTAIAGFLGNVANESGFNPWRWQNDVVSWASDHGYGLVQFTPASYYIGINGRGQNFPEYAPNISVTGTTIGSSPNDGEAQLKTIEIYHDDKFFNRQSYCDYTDISSAYPYSSYKTLNDLWIATVGWLFNYEFPAARYRDYEHAMARYNTASRCYEIITGSQPPDPPIPPTPSRKKMPVWMMVRPLTI